MSEVLELLDTFEVMKRSRGPTLVSSVLESCAFHESVLQAESSQVQRVLDTISKALSGPNTGSKLSGLKALDMVLGQISPETLASTGLKLIQQVVKVVSRPGESRQILTSGYRCLDRLVRLTSAHSDIGRQVAGMISGLVSGCLACPHPSTSLPFLACLMEVYPGSCGHARPAAENTLSAHIGQAQLDPNLLGKCFGLLPQLGGGGKEGVEHQRLWGVTFNKLMATSTQVLDELFEHVKEFDRPQVGGVNKLELTEAAGSALDKAYSDQRKVCDLLSCLARMLTDPFPQLKAIPVDDVLSLASRILAVTPASLAKTQMQELTVLSAVLPNIHLSALHMVSSLVNACRDELLPVTADINNIVVDGLKGAKVGGVRKAVYNLMEVWCQVVGPACSLEICAQQILELVVHDIVPPQQKLLLSSKPESTKKKNKKGGGYQKPSKPATSTNSGISPSVCVAALSGLESLIRACGPYIRPELHKDIGCVLVSQCLDQTCPPPYTQPSCLSALYSCLATLVLHSSPAFPSPARLALPVLSKASSHHHLGVARAAGKGLAAVQALVHPRCPSLAVPVLGEEQIRQVVASVVNGKEDQGDVEDGEDLAVECEEVVVEEVRSDKSCVPGDLIQDIIKAKASIRNAIERGDLGRKMEKENDSQQSVAVKRASTDELDVEMAKRSKFDDNLQNVESDKESDNDGSKSEDENVCDAIVDSKNAGTSVLSNANEKFEVADSSKTGDTSIAASNEPSAAEEGLDVDTMLKDFSDKLNKNLLPNPWESDDDSS